jgi:hypothetical protein
MAYDPHKKVTPNWLAWVFAGVVCFLLKQLWDGWGVFLGLGIVLLYELWHRWKYGVTGL